MSSRRWRPSPSRGIRTGRRGIAGLERSSGCAPSSPQRLAPMPMRLRDPSASAGTHAIATALAFDTDRRTVVLGEFEFPTMGHVWLAQQRRGARVVWAKAQADPAGGSICRVHRRANADRSAGHVCFRNGYRIDIPRLVRSVASAAHTSCSTTSSGPARRRSTACAGRGLMVTGALKYLLGPPGWRFSRAA